MTVDSDIESQHGKRHYHKNENIAPTRKTNTLKPNIGSNILMFNTKTTTSLTLRKQ